MAEPMTTVHLGDAKGPVSKASPVPVNEKANYHVVEYEEPPSASTLGSRQHDPLLGSKPPQSPVPDEKTLSSAGSTPLKDEFPEQHQTDEERQEEEAATKKKALEHKKRILDIAQRTTSLILSIIILTVMAHAYVVFRQNENVTHDGTRIYPTFMQLWPTYLMIATGAITVALNALVLYWKVHNTVRDLVLIDTSTAVWDYASRGVNFALWLGTSSSFQISKNWGPAANPNVLWGYVCSPTAAQLSAAFPEIIRFYVQCEIQTVSFWLSVSAVIVEGFGFLTKVFLG